jgi:hypothetical protein
MKKLFPALLATLAACALIAGSAGAATIQNGDFSDGLNGWTILAKPLSDGSWWLQTSAVLPISSHEHIGPLSGTSLVSDENGPISAVVYQDVALEPESTHQLSLSYWYNSYLPFVHPEPVNFDLDNSAQQIRIDVLKPTADPFSATPGDILTTILDPGDSDATVKDWTPLSVDLSGFAGQTVRLRAVNHSKQSHLHFGIDSISIASTPFPAPLISGTYASPKSYRLKSGRQGVTVRYSLSRDATVVAVIQKSAPGRRSGKKCAKPTTRNKKGRRCTRWLKLTTLTYAGTAGANSFKFDGKIGRKRVGAGSYRITLTPNTAMTHGETKTVSFKVKSAKKKR